MIDVIITVYKPDERLRRLLLGLHKQDIKVNRIILINTEEKYWKEEWILGIPEAEVYHISALEFDHGRTRRMGADLSTGDFMVFMTQDAVPADSQLITNLKKAFSDSKVAAAYARQLPYEDCNPIERYTRMFNYPAESRLKTRADIASMGIKAFFSSDVCAMYRKDSYNKLGGFVERAIFNEDMIFARKALDAGMAVFYAAEARVYHSHNYNNLQQFKRNFDLAVSQSDHPEIFSGIKSETEGIRMVIATARHLLRTGKWYLLPKLAAGSGVKFFGYKLGLSYKKLPGRLVLMCTSNVNYWKSCKEGH